MKSIGIGGIGNHTVLLIPVVDISAVVVVRIKWIISQPNQSTAYLFGASF